MRKKATELEDDKRVTRLLGEWRRRSELDAEAYIIHAGASFELLRSLVIDSPLLNSTTPRQLFDLDGQGTLKIACFHSC
jgi:hypothetical protein